MANLGQKELECAIINNVLFSDHVPLKVRLDINVDHVFERNYCRKLAWHKASTELINQYSSDLEYKLSMLQYDEEALLCKNVMCKKHDNELYRVYNDILNMCIESSGYIPTTCPKNNLNSGGGRRKLPGWSKEVEHLKQEAIFWHRQWRAVGKSHQGDITEMRRITRARYHRAVRHIMREDDRISSTKMTEAISENRNRDLWSEVRRIKGRNKFLPSSIDGVVGDEEIAQLLSDKYNHLYNSVSYDVDEMNVINTEINKQIKENVAYYISVEEVIEDVQRLKLGKSDGDHTWPENFNHIIHGPKILFVLLALIFNSMLVHGFSHDSMLVGTMVPIPKDKRQLVCTSDKFRAITLGSIVAKLFDVVILSKKQNVLATSYLQLGFKQNMSTTRCKYVMMETISYYNANGSNV